MADGGWIKLYRKTRRSFVWTDPNLLKLWMLLLFKASRGGNRFLFNGQEIPVSNGQLVTGAYVLASEFNEGMPRDKAVTWRTVWRWVKRFEKAEMLTINSTPQYSVITVLNWDEYQSSDKPVTNPRQEADNSVSTNKNSKNTKKEPSSPAKAEPSFNYAGVIQYLNEQSGKHFRDTPNNRKLIKARLNDGFTSHDIAVVITNVVTGWKGTEMEQYIRPATIFAASKFEGYLNAVPKALNHNNAQSELEPEPVPHTFSAAEYAISAYQTGSSVDEIIAMAKDEGAPATPDEIRAAIDEYNKRREEDA